MPGCEVRAFGSRATRTAKDYSALDLAVVGNGPIDSRALGRLKAALDESDLPMRVDVLDWHFTSESFREAIEPDHVIVQEGMGKQATSRGWREVTSELSESFPSNWRSVPFSDAVFFQEGPGIRNLQ